MGRKIRMMCAAMALCLIGLGTVEGNAAGEVSVSAECAVLMDGEGHVLFARNAQARHGIASTTKIMTALVALENMSPEAMITVPAEATGLEGTSIYLCAGERLTLHELLYAVMLNSANDAASAVAISVAGSVEAFADLMNQKAAELGMTQTHFTNPHGLPDPDHYSTAEDMGRLTVYAMQNPAFREIVSTSKKQISRTAEDGICYLVNHNKMLYRYQGAIGVKTGFTKKSGRCLVSAAERDGIMMIAVTLNAPDDWRDHAAMLDYGFSLYERETLLTAGELRMQIPVAGGTFETAEVTNETPLTAVFPRDHGALTVRYELRSFYYAPLSQGEILGYAVLYEDGREAARCALCALNPVEERSVPDTAWQRAREWMRTKLHLK